MMKLKQALILLLLTGGSFAWRFSRRRRDERRSSSNDTPSLASPSVSSSSSSATAPSIEHSKAKQAPTPKAESSNGNAKHSGSSTVQSPKSSQAKSQVVSPTVSMPVSTSSTAPTPLDPATGQPYTSNPLQFLYQKGVHLWETIRLVKPTLMEPEAPAPPTVVIPPPSLSEQFLDDPIGFVYAQIITLLLYKPPVGMVAAYTLTRLIVTRRLFRLYAPSSPDNSVDAVLQKQQQRQPIMTMPYVLEENDLQYKRFGGIDRVRQQLIQAALEPYEERMQQEHQSMDDSNYSDNQKKDPLNKEWSLLQTTMEGLSTTCRPGDRQTFVREMIPSIAQMETLIRQQPTHKQQPQDDKQLYEQLLQGAMDSNHVRLMDALLRVARDRLLRVAYRLAKTVEFWSRRVEELPPFWGNLEREQVRLAYAKAAYQAEIKRLGQVALLLLQRPADLPEEALLHALQSTNEKAMAVEEESSDDEESQEPIQGDATRASPWKQFQNAVRKNDQKKVKEVVSLSWKARLRQYWKKVCKYPIHLRTLVRGFFTIRKLESEGSIDSEAATDVILAFSSKQETWSKDVEEWVQQGKALLCQIIRESLKGSSSGGGFAEEEFAQLERSWLDAAEAGDDLTSVAEKIEKDWTQVLRYVDSLPLWRRVGEGRAVRLKDAAIVSWSRRLNVLGLPLAGLQIAIAHQVHKVINPHLPTLKADTINAFKKFVEIVKERGWEPIHGIWQELMNQGKTIMSGFGLQLEERSLDHMLRDLGFGDGTAASRESALEGAATQYEKDLKQGLLLNFASGRLVRLLLVQVQQLKVGMLQALDTINVLMKGNQIHFQILAAIPAVLIVTIGTRLFVRALYNFRAKDLRPVTAAHGEMTVYLNHLETLVLLAFQRGQPGESIPGATYNGSVDPGVLGELLLYTHRYLILLDFSKWSIPSRASEDIHGSLRQLTSAMMSWTTAQTENTAAEDGQQLDKDLFLTQNMQWVRIVKDRHDRLNQYF